MIEITAKVLNWLKDMVQFFYPLMLCLFGALTLQTDLGWFSTFLAGLTFVWALDLAATRAAAKAKVETAATFVALMVRGADTQITVDINHNEGK